MAEQAKPVAVSTDFQGLIINADPRDLPAGAAEEQLNMANIMNGVVVVRLGLKEVVFTE